MDSPDALNIPATAPITQQAVVPAFPILSSSTANPLPRSPNRPPVPLSAFELLPTEIHIAIIEELVNIDEGFITRDGLCKLARTSPVFTRIVQKRLYLEIVLDGDEQACEWLESDATIRGEFATRMLTLSAEEGQLVGAETVETVLAMQTSVLDELFLFNVESVKSSALSAFTNLLVLSLDMCEIKMDDSPDKPTFRLNTLCIVDAKVPSPYLSDLMASSSTSLRFLQIEDAIHTEDDFDWNRITFTTSPRLQELHLAGRHIPPLLNLLSGCENLGKLRLYRYNDDPEISDSTIQLSQLSKELASLPKRTLKTATLALFYVGRSGGDTTLQEVEDLIALPSLATLEELRLFVPGGWAGSDVEALRRNKGTKEKLVVTVDVET